MRFSPAECATETFTGNGPGGTLILGDFREKADELTRRFAGTVQTVYLDPPFNTGKEFVFKQRVSTEGWQKGRPVLTLPAYSDVWDDERQLLDMLRQAAELSHTLLREDGSFFLHIDSRLHARARLMCDEIFGEKAFVNEIIWAYKSGGRSQAHFSRKHDIILFYRKTPRAYFNIAAVGVPRTNARNNHMRRGVDESGRVYRSIVTQGKEYRYYDDEEVFPGDVWEDVSHLQQKDPQRTGYDTQKPARLLERIIACSSRPGDLVCDLFGGSGQMALEALSRGAERATVVDNSRAACEIIRANAVKTKLMEQCRVVCSDWKDFVKTASGKEKFDLVFLDPPYNDGVLEGVLKKLKALDLLAPGAIIVAESAQTGVPVPDDSWSARVYRYGKTFVMIMRLPEQAAAGEESV